MTTDAGEAQSGGRREARSKGAPKRRDAAAGVSADPDANKESPARTAASAGVTVPTMDTETASALTLYNTYVTADREQQAHERAVRKAERAKDEAAAVVRKLRERKTPSSETADAEAKYREAVDALRRVRDGETAAIAETSDQEAVETADQESTDEAAQDNENSA